MSADVQEFRHEFIQDVVGESDASRQYLEDSFFELFCEQLIDAGELEAADRAHMASRGLRVDGYGGDPLQDDGALSLIALDFSQATEMGSLTATEMEAAFKRLANFVTKSLDPDFRDSMEETDPAFGLADMIAARWPSVTKIRMFLLSDRLLSSRVDGLKADSILGAPVTYSVWDMGRLHRFVASGHGREEIVIDLVEQFNAGWTALPAHLKDADYKAYLVVIPGQQLAAIYDRWHTRLLEQNVRVFLQARGNVNKGIRNTIVNDPEMFFAYNNGITATAEGLETRVTAQGLEITKLSNLQIVNGGQTTASIHAESMKKGADLSHVFVQMKLSIIDPERAVEVVPRISEYANSQNKVSAADFFANHPFHIRIEGFSRRLYAPSAEGTFRESKWFYERARGQFQDARANLTGPERRKFDGEYPRRQVLTKTDFAKYVMVWRGHPDIVSKGAQKNFAEFARQIGSEWATSDTGFNEQFYKHAIAQAIIFRATEKMVSSQAWYDGGYRANIVAYAIAKLAYDVAARGNVVDFGDVWRRQSLPDALSEALIVAAECAQQVLVNPMAGYKNITEWAKQPACRERVQRAQVSWPDRLDDVLLSATDARQEQSESRKDQRLLNRVEAQTSVLNAGAGFWRDFRAWGDGKGLLSEKEQSILRIAVSMPGQIPTERQCAVLLAAVRRLRGEGYPGGADIL